VDETYSLEVDRAGTFNMPAKDIDPHLVDVFTLPSDLLAAYHRLVEKRVTEGLTPAEEMELRGVSRKLDLAELSTPIEHAIDAKSTHEHQKSLEALNDVITRLKNLQR